MTLKECYDAAGGNYNDVMGRLPKESSIIRFLRKFASDGDFSEMLEAFENKNYEILFAKAHNIKGMCANLSLTALSRSSSDLCEAVRGGEPESDITPLIDKVKADYEKTVAAINQLED